MGGGERRSRRSTINRSIVTGGNRGKENRNYTVKVKLVHGGGGGGGELAHGSFHN